MFRWHCRRFLHAVPAIGRGLGVDGDPFPCAGLPAQDPSYVPKVHVFRMKSTAQGTPGFLHDPYGERPLGSLPALAEYRIMYAVCDLQSTS